jgi:hypothetical protein
MPSEAYWQGPITRSYEVVRIVALTQAAYDALSPPDPLTLYLIIT